MVLSGDRPPNEKIISALYTCPNTGARVQGWIADDGSEDGSETYERNSGDAINGLCAATTRGREKDRVKDRVRCHPLHLPPRIADFGLAFCRRCPIFQAMLRPSAMYA